LVRRGHDAAFEALVSRYESRLLGFCRHMLGSREEAEDAVQQTFVSAYRDLTASAKPIRLKPWLYTIARNRCLSILRSRHQEAAELADIPTAGPSDAVLERDEVRRLLEDVRRLPDDQRAALVLSELGDLSHSEVAQVVGCEAVQVKSLVFQARSSLIASKQAADIPCAEIREQIANARGADLRRGLLRRHVRGCPACSQFRVEVRRQRELLALALPVLPTAALKESVLTAAGLSHTATGSVAAGGTFAGGTAASGGVAGGTATCAGAGIAGAGGATGGGVLATVGALGGAKLAVIAALAAGVAGGGLALREADASHHRDAASSGSVFHAGGRGASSVAAGRSGFSGGMGRAFGAKLGSGLAVAAGHGGNASANGPKGAGSNHRRGRGNAGGHGNGKGNRAAPQSSGSHTGGGGTTSGNRGGPPPHAGNGNGSGNGHGGGNGNGAAPGSAGHGPTAQPRGSAHGRSGERSGPAVTTDPPSTGAQDGNAGRHLGGGSGGGG
jgi:RNA polymerase sigma factor (sigma-70 family)